MDVVSIRDIHHQHHFKTGRMLIMTHIKVVWKDSATFQNKRDYKYRDIVIRPHGKGWIIDIDGDCNIYKSHTSAINAIDKALGGATSEAAQKRNERGIKTIGKTTETA